MNNRTRYSPLVADQFRGNPRNPRLGNTWSDRRWRRFVCLPLVVVPRASPFQQAATLDGETGGPEPRAGWTPKTNLGGVWAQPVRHFS